MSWQCASMYSGESSSQRAAQAAEHMRAAHLASLVAFKVLVEALVKPVQVLDASDAIQPALTDLLSASRSNVDIATIKALGWAVCMHKCNLMGKASHMVTSISGSWPPLSAASNEFSTSSLTVV